jgi:hypothetical protein
MNPDACRLEDDDRAGEQIAFDRWQIGQVQNDLIRGPSRSRAAE